MERGMRRVATGGKRTDFATGPGVDEHRIDGIVVGRIVRVSSDEMGVDLSSVGLPGPVPVRSTARLTSTDAGREAVVMFEGGDVRRPILLGLMHDPLDDYLGESSPGSERLDAAPQPEVRVDGERCVIEAEREIELRCGKSSITLCADGTIRVRGSDVMTRSSGTNRVRGASVRIN